MAMFFGIVLLLFGLLVPPMLFPHENQILVGFVGAPFILFGFILMLIGAFPTQRLEDKRKDDKDGPRNPDGR